MSTFRGFKSASPAQTEGKGSRRLRRAAVTVGLMAGLAMATTGTAEAAATVGGANFSSTVMCDANMGRMEVSTQASADQSYAMVFVKEASSGTWVASNWYPVGGYTMISDPLTFSGTGTYSVYIEYDVRATDGSWLSTGEYITTFNQASAGGYGTDLSPTCTI